MIRYATMKPYLIPALASCLAASVLGAPARGGGSAAKPKVRAITAFVRVDRRDYRAQIERTLGMLRQAKAAFERAGYQVETVRITTEPFTEVVRGLSREEALEFFQAYDELAVKEAFDPSLGPAMLRDSDDPAAVVLLGEALSRTKVLHGTVIVAADDGLHPKSIRAAAEMVKAVAERSPHGQANFRFAATAMLAPYSPFFPGSYHLGAGHRFAIGLESANVVADAFQSARGDPQAASARLTRALSEHAVRLEKLAKGIERQTGWTYMGLDLSPAPLREVSIGAAIEKLNGARFGSSGTLAAAALITRALAQVPVKRVGYSGLMLPVLEDSVLAERWSEGAFGIDSLLAYSAVCGTGLDTIPLPGEVSTEQLERIIGDMAALAFKWRKPLSARLLPVPGRKAGERTEFDDPFLVNATIQPLP